MVLLMVMGTAGYLGLVICVTIPTAPAVYPSWVFCLLFSVVLLSYGGVKSIIGPWFVENYGQENLGSVLGLHALAYGLAAASAPVLVAHTTARVWGSAMLGTYVVGTVAAVVVQLALTLMHRPVLL